MRIQLWSYNFTPEPTGIGPVSGAWAHAMSDRGHDVEVISAHPHYPEPRWGIRWKPYREEHSDMEVLRLPLWPGRANALQRIRQEVTFCAALGAAAPTLATPDVVVATSPSFPGLAPAIVNARARGIPWVLWLFDILPDAATATGILSDGVLVKLARWFESQAYESAARIIVISDTFRDNLLEKGVPAAKLVHSYTPASRPIRDAPRPPASLDERSVFTMGNIGRTQNLLALVRAFENSGELEAHGARFVIAGDGVAAGEVRQAVRTDRVVMPGLLDTAQLEEQLSHAAVAVVSQRYDGHDINVPSKLMNFMAYGIPVVASLRPDSEAARLIERSGGGWVTTSDNPDDWATQLATALRDRRERLDRGAAALRFAHEHFAVDRMADRVTDLLSQVVAEAPPARFR